MANLQNPVKAIRAKCLDCCCGNSAEVKLCPSTDCALHPFRLGKNPYRAARKMSEEEKAKCIERLSKGRKAAVLQQENTED